MKINSTLDSFKTAISRRSLKNHNQQKEDQSLQHFRVNVSFLSSVTISLQDENIIHFTTNKRTWMVSHCTLYLWIYISQTPRFFGSNWLVFTAMNMLFLHRLRIIGFFTRVGPIKSSSSPQC